MADARYAAVILAAGKSSRLGSPKALLDINGVFALEHLGRVYLRAGLDPVVAVVNDVSRVAVPEGAVAVDGDPEGEMIDSVIRGLDGAGDVAGALVQPVDAIRTNARMVRTLLDGAGQTIRVLTHQGTPGHPIYIPQGYFAAVRSRPGGGLRALVDERAEQISWASADILVDIDDEADRARWLPDAAT